MSAFLKSKWSVVLRWLRRRKWSRLAFPVLLLAIGAWLYLGSAAPSYTQCSYNKERTATKEEKKSAYYRPSLFLNCEVTVLNANSGALTAAATVLLTWVTYLLWGL